MCIRYCPARRIAVASIIIVAIAFVSKHAEAQSATATPQELTKKLRPEPPQFRIFALRNLKAQDAVVAVSNLLRNESGLALSAEERTNTVLARGPSDVMEIVESMLQRLDEPGKALAVEPQNTLKVYNLRSMQASDAIDVISPLLHVHAGSRASFDRKLNRVIVLASEEAHAMVEAVLQQIDQQGSSPNRKVTSVVNKESLPISSKGDLKLAVGAAKQSEVDFEYVEELDVAVVRGSQEAVNEFVNSMAQIRSALAQQKVSEAQTAAKRTHAIRIVWLASGEEVLDTNSSKLDAIRKRAEQFGIRNLAQVGQLIASSRTEKDSPASFTVGGTAILNEVPFELMAEGSLAAIDDDETAFTIRLSIGAAPIGRNPQGAARATVVDVDMQLGAGKPVILAAVPIDGKQSVFVVEIVTIP